jgi:outer membrane receptor protein involved in Fe transport
MDFAGFSKVSSRLLSGAVALALASSAAWGADAPAADTAAASADTGNELETVVVTSTRLQNAGFDSPTPTQVLNSEALTQVAQPNLFDAVIQLPALQGSTGTTYETGSTSTGLQGLSALSLRGFTPVRTLTLLDGQRVVGANYNQTVDVSLLPQMLIQRVDVVTGGASASWGSDAVAGVVNFVTDKKFNGFKADVSYGMSSYGDNSTTTAKVAAGIPFLDGRGHFEIAGEYTKDDGVIAEGNPLNNFGCGGIDGRTFDSCAGTVTAGATATNAGNPYIAYSPYLQGYNVPNTAIITNGPLQGTTFVGGVPSQFQYASGGVPSLSLGTAGSPINTAAAGVTATSPGGLCTGGTCLALPGQTGNLAATQAQAATLVEPITRDTTYARLSFDITPTTEIYATYNFANSITVTLPTTTFGEAGLLAVPCTSPYLLGTGVFGNGGYAAEEANCATAYPRMENTSKGLGSPTGPTVQVGLAGTFGAYQNVTIDRKQNRFVLGGDGAFDVIGKNVTWDGYFEYGTNSSTLNIYNMPLFPNVWASLNATQNASGQAVCAYAPAAAAGCIPYNVFNTQSNSQAAVNYIMGSPANGPWDQITQVQEAGGLDFNFKPVSLWAGDLSVAFGVDYRLENYHAYADPYGNGTLATPGGAATPYDALYPSNPNFNAAIINGTFGNVWYAGNYHDGNGQYTVEEAFLETGVPLYKIPGWGSLDADVAGRYEHYSTAGSEYTWKLGLVWQTPLSGVRLRATDSVDLRAPNLGDLYAPPSNLNQGGNYCLGGVTCTSANQVNTNFTQQTLGNPNLIPETSHNLELGVVFEPDYIRGLHASADWYRINVTNIIGTPYNVQNILDNCDKVGLTQFCSQQFISTVGGVNINSPTCITNPAPCGINTVFIKEVNLASTLTEGLDLELAYSWELRKWGVPGAFQVRGLATHTYGFNNCPNTAGSICTDYAGALGNFSTSTPYASVVGTIPKWKTVFTEQYGDAWGNLFLSQRWFNAGTVSNNYIQCNPGSCPVESSAVGSFYPTIADNHMPGALYWDAGVNLNVWGSKAEIYGKVNNIANLLPPTTPAGINLTTYDVVGRMYYAGFRIHL